MQNEGSPASYVRIFFFSTILVLGFLSLNPASWFSGLPTGSFTAAAGASSIAVSIDAARISGVAPLSVFFDASGTTDPAVTYPFHQLDYKWDFGDPNSGTWTNGSNPGNNSRNVAYSPEVAHIFEPTAGEYDANHQKIYTVRVDVTDGISTSFRTVDITVQDPDYIFSGTNTICIAANSTPTAGSGGCPTGADVHQDSDFGHAVNTYAAPSKRILFRRGDSFVSKTQGILTAAGPGIIGAYGTGAKPYITTTLTGQFTYELFLKSNVQDWRIMDLEMDGKLDGTIGGIQFAGGNYSQVLLDRIFIHDIGGGVTLSIAPNAPSIPDQISMADTTIQHIVATAGGPVEGSFWAARRLALMGNFLSDTLTGVSEHLLRVQYTDRAFINNNTISKVNPAKEMIAIRQICAATCQASADFSGVGLTGTAAATKRVVISDNHLLVNSYIGVQTDFSGAGGATAGYAFDVILERNWYDMQSGSGSPITLHTDGATVRNEIIDTTLSTGHTGVTLRGFNYFLNASPSNNAWIYNNTMVNRSGTGITMVNVTDTYPVSNIYIQNNLGYAPTAGRETNYIVPTLTNGTITGSFLFDHNSTGSAGVGTPSNQMQLSNPNFVSASPTSVGGFALTSGSYAIGSGIQLTGANRDFYGNLRGGTIDLGAIQFSSFVPPSTTPPPTTPPPTVAVPVVTLTSNLTSGTVNVANPSLTWSATNSPTSCTASGDWSGTKGTSGTSVSQGVLGSVKTYTYTLTCTNSGGTSAPASVAVVALAAVTTPPPSGAPVVTLSSDVTSGTVNLVNPKLTWSATNNPTSCTASGDWTGTRLSSGTLVSQGVLNGVRTYTYTLTCTNASGTSAPASVAVVSSAAPVVTTPTTPVTTTTGANPPTLTFTASASSVSPGAVVLLSWDARGANVCAASGSWTGGVALPSGGLTTSSLFTDQTFTLKCDGAGGTITKTVTVSVIGSGTTVTPSTTASSGVSSITPGGGSLTDAGGHTWTFQSGGTGTDKVILKDGAPAAGGSGIALAVKNGVIYTKNSANTWFSFTNGGWVVSSDPGLAGSTPASSGPSSITSSSFVGIKYGKTAADVRLMQKILNADLTTRVARTGPGSPGNETTFFGAGTRAAVIKFQEKYPDEILIPNGLAQGTGVVGPSTQRQLRSVGQSLGL